MDFETPEADAVEQTQQDVEATDEELPEGDTAEARPDVDPADLAEQRAAVPEDDGYDHD